MQWLVTKLCQFVHVCDKQMGALATWGCAGVDEQHIAPQTTALTHRPPHRCRALVLLLCRYLIDPPTDSDDPKKQYRYVFGEEHFDGQCCEGLKGGGVEHGLAVAQLPIKLLRYRS